MGQRDTNILFDDIPVPFQSLDSQGIILDINTAWINILGYCDKAEVTGKRFEEFLDQDDAKSFNHHFSQLLAGKSNTPLELNLKHKKGFFVPVRYRGKLSGADSSQKSIQCIIQDISEEKKHRSFYEAIFNNSTTGYAVFKAIEGGKDFIFVDFNAQAEKIEGIPKEELIGKAVTEAFPSITGSPLMDVFQKVYRTGIADTVDSYYYKNIVNEGYRTNKVFKLPSGEIVANFFDSTEFEMSKQLIEAAFNAERNLVCIIRNNELEQCNRAFLKFIDFAHIRDFKSEYDCVCDLFEEDDEKSYIGKEINGVNWLEYTMQHQNQMTIKTKITRNGITHIFSIYAGYIEAAVSERYIVVFDDITSMEVHSTELEQLVLEKTREHELALLQQHKLQAMKEMMTSISHHWRQPLTTISICAENAKMAAQESAGFDQGALDGLEIALKEIQFLSTTISHFTEFNQESKEKTHFNLCSELDQVMTLMQPELNSLSIDISFSCACNKELYYYGNNNEIKRILYSIIENAKDAILAKRESTNIFSQGHITVSTQKKKEILSIHVRDDGTGMNDEIKEHYFDPYFSTKFPSKGTGMSMYMNKLLLEQYYRGNITVNNKLKEGVEIILSFPVERKK